MQALPGHVKELDFSQDYSNLSVEKLLVTHFTGEESDARRG